MPYTPDPQFARTQILNRLNDDSVITTLVGTVINRPPRRDKDGFTASAFDADMRIKPTMFVPETRQGQGQNNSLHPLAYTESVRVFFVGPADEERKDILRTAKQRTRRLLTLLDPDDPFSDEPWYFINDDGRRMFPQKVVIDSGLDSSEIIVGGGGAVQGFLQFTYDGQRSR